MLIECNPMFPCVGVDSWSYFGEVQIQDKPYYSSGMYPIGFVLNSLNLPKVTSRRIWIRDLKARLDSARIIIIKARIGSDRNCIHNWNIYRYIYIYMYSLLVWMTALYLSFVINSFLCACVCVCVFCACVCVCVGFVLNSKHRLVKLLWGGSNSRQTLL